LAQICAAPKMRPRKTGIVAARITGMRRAAVSGAARGITATMRRQFMYRDCSERANTHHTRDIRSGCSRSSSIDPRAVGPEPGAGFLDRPQAGCNLDCEGRHLTEPRASGALCYLFTRRKSGCRRFGVGGDGGGRMIPASSKSSRTCSLIKSRTLAGRYRVRAARRDAASTIFVARRHADGRTDRRRLAAGRGD
jgi:hypothetical protein